MHAGFTIAAISKKKKITIRRDACEECIPFAAIHISSEQFMLDVHNVELHYSYNNSL
jgi:hypothetical protein